eukprot:2967459-Amphidinium_carterae.2
MSQAEVLTIRLYVMTHRASFSTVLATLQFRRIGKCRKKGLHVAIREGYPLSKTASVLNPTRL